MRRLAQWGTTAVALAAGLGLAGCGVVGSSAATGAGERLAPATRPASVPPSAAARSSSTPAAVATAPSVSTPAPPPLTVSSSPRPGRTAVSPATPIVLRFSAALDATEQAVQPVLDPPLAGQWQRTGPAELTFTPAAAPLPLSRQTVRVPAGVRSAGGAVLASDYEASWSMPAGSTSRLQALLAEAGYLPLTYTGAPSDDPYTDASGFSWRWPATPPALQALWAVGVVTPITAGAITAFEDDHQLGRDGAAGSKVWSALLADASVHRVADRPYTWVEVTKSVPQKAQLWRDGEYVSSTRANTGIAAAPTPSGSWPVYLRLTTQTMSGTNPDGSHYSDPGSPWISYFHGGDALHGFLRESYGTPQSLGCVELPIDAANDLWHAIGYGTVVTVHA